METWIHDAILDGLSRLLCLGMDRTPAADMIAGTAAAWVEAITTGRSFDEARDRPRFRAAFVTLAQTREMWPQPKHFLDALPRVEQVAIGYEVKPATPEQAAAAMARIEAMLRPDRKTQAAGADA